MKNQNIEFSRAETGEFKSLHLIIKNLMIMDCLQLKYRLFSDQNVERILYVRVYKLVDDDEKTDKVLEVLNIPFFVEEDDLKSLFKCDVQIKLTSKATNKLKSKTALVEFPTKKELKNELRLIKYSDENEKAYLYKSKVSAT